MRCIYCHNKTKVIDTRHYNENTRKRMIKCLRCKKKFITIERAKPLIQLESK